MEHKTYLIVNFGGPRHLLEVEEFLIELLTDQEVIRTPLPRWVHRILFKRVAKKRSKKIIPDYASIGGKSPIYEDTESIAQDLKRILNAEVLTFHRYLPETHPSFIETMESLEINDLRVFPLFPQFSYATTGSIALWLKEHLTPKTLHKLQWIKSYSDHFSYTHSMQRQLGEFLKKNELEEERVFLLFSAHGLPQSFINQGDPYQAECISSFEQIKSFFPKALSLLSYQSQFGKEEWIRPYTSDVCASISSWTQGRKCVVVIPLSFTSDHIETLYEIEQIYLPSIRKLGFSALRCPALNLCQDWINTIAELLETAPTLPNHRLLRK